MNISLTSELETLVSEKVSSGMYQTASEVVREALRLLKERDEFRDRRLKQLRRDLRAGMDEIDRGEFIEFDAQDSRRLAARVKSRGVKRLAKQGKTGTR